MTIEEVLANEERQIFDRKSINIEPKTCLELSKIENIVAIKEASGNLSQVAEIAHLCGENLHIYSGNDDQIVPILSLGGIAVGIATQLAVGALKGGADSLLGGLGSLGDLLGNMY